MTRDDTTRDLGPVHFSDEDGCWVYRASGLGNCIGGLVRARMGVDADPPPDWLQEKFDQGRDLEDDVLDGVPDEFRLFDEDQLIGLGFTIDTLGQIEGEISFPVPGGDPVVVRCHPDGLAEHPEHGLVAVEGKALAESTAATIWKDMPAYYKWQISVEALVCGVDKVLFVVGVKNDTGDEIVRHEMRLLDPPFSKSDARRS